MIIKPGHTYRMRNGQQSPSVERHHGSGLYVWRAGSHTYTAEGRVMTSLESPLDLMAQWEPGGADKLICDVTLDDYRRGFANMSGRVM